MKKIKHIYFVVLAIIILAITALFLLDMLGFSFNKNYLTYDADQCISKQESKIQGCTFWMRANNLEKSEGWGREFNDILKENGLKEYCDNPEQWKDDGSFSFTGPKECRYTEYADAKRDENWSYLTSSNEDGFRAFCIEQACPKQTLFK